MAQLDKRKPIPLYYQIVEIVRGQIEAGELTPGERLPTEQWFGQQYDISRITVRKALSELAAMGLIEQIRGKGSIVANRKFNRKLARLTGLHEELAQAGLASTSKISDVKRKPAQGVEARRLGVEDGEPLLCFRRLRYSDGKPIADQKIWLRESFCEGFDPMDLEHESLYQILENRYGLSIDYADQTIGVRPPTKKQMEELEIHDKTNLMQMKRTTYLVSGEAIEYTEIFYVADRYEFSIRLYR